jgi:tripeptidyl-peptidase-2
MVKVEKGDYVLKLHIRHEKKDLLDKMVDQSLLLNQKLPSALSLDVYGSWAQATTSGKKLEKGSLPQGQTVPIYVTPLTDDR